MDLDFITPKNLDKIILKSENILLVLYFIPIILAII